MSFTRFDSPDLGIVFNENQIAKWVDRIVNRVIETRRNTIALFDNFPPQHVHCYKALQERIAQIIPKEQERPFIMLNIRGLGRINDGYAADIGLAGGTGPLSDASALVKLIDKIKAEDLINFSAVLYSMPPPRDGLRIFTDGINFRNLYKQARAKYPCTSLHILTNTGHVFKQAFQSNFLMGNEVNGQVDDMTVKLANKIANDKGQGESILVLGTSMAEEKKLYYKLLTKRGLKPIYPSENKVLLQQIINKAKEGKINEPIPDEEKTWADRLLDIAQKHATKEGQKCSGILFGCTELSFILYPFNFKMLLLRSRSCH